MKFRKLPAMLATFLLSILVVVAGCKVREVPLKVLNANSNTSPAKPTADGVVHSGTGEEKEKPEAGKTNVQGKVLFNDKPAGGIEVKLCEKFSQYFSGCGGQTFSTKTDSNGEYLFSIHADSSTSAKTEFDYINKRVDSTSFVLEKPLAPGGYSVKVTAYNGNDRKLADSPRDIKFTVTP